MDKFEINNINSISLDNGLQIYVNERAAAPIATVQAWIKTGSIHEEEFLGCGLSHFLEHMLFHGSKNYPGQKIVDTIHQLGGDMNAYTSLGHTVYYIEVPAMHIEKATEIITDMVMNPLFPEEKFMDEKNIILRERDMHGDNPSRVLSEKVWHEMFTVHPARHPIIGYKSKIESVDRDMMVEYHKRRYSPDRTFFIVSGMVETEDIFKIMEDRLASWDRGDLREPFLPQEPIQLSARDATYAFSDPLTRISMSWHIPQGGHPDVAALDILSGILGQNKSSRLVRNLKIRKNLALSVSCFSYTPSFCGIFGINALCVPENEAKLEEELVKEIERLKTGTFKKEELAREVSQLETEYLRALRSNNSVVRIIGNSILSYGSPVYVNKYIEDLRSVTIDDLKRVTAQYFDLEKVTTIKIIPKETDKQDKEAVTVKDIHNLSAYNKPELKQLPGGQRLIEYRDDSLPLIDIGVVLPGGAFFESKEKAGISSLVAAMLNAGTASYSEMELLHLLDENAIELAITPGNNSIALKLNCHKNKLALAMEAFKSILKESLFAEKQFKREKNIAIEKLKSREVSPQGCAEDAMLEQLFHDHPYSIPRHGLRKGVETLSAEDVKDFYFNECLQPEMAVFGIAGNYDSKSIKRLEHMIKDLPWAEKSELNVKPPVFPTEPVLQKIANPRSQAVVLNAVPGCSNLSESRYCVDILQSAMNGQGANIFKKIREEAGLAYYTGMITSRGFQQGYISFYAGTHPDAADQVAKMMNEERNRLATKGLTIDEFNAAKAYIAHNHAGQMEDPGSMILQCCLAEYYGNGFSIPFEQHAVFEKITFEEANKVVRELMSNPAPVTIISAPEQHNEQEK